MITLLSLLSSPVATMNTIFFLNGYGDAPEEMILRHLRTNGTCALMALAEICIRNPNRIEGGEVGFSRRDRTLGFTLVEKFLSGYDLISSEDAIKACELAYRYRKQILRFIPSCPEVTIEETETEIVL
jgi:hypothetical protein